MGFPACQYCSILDTVHLHHTAEKPKASVQMYIVSTK